jgi:hypothetical protein
MEGSEILIHHSNDDLQNKEFVEVKNLINVLDNCPEGIYGCRQYEDICIRILERLFVPPLGKARIQSRTESGNDIRDAIFPNRSDEKNWKFLREKYDANYIVFEFKNYSKKGADFNKHPVLQVSNYLKPTIGKFGIICSKKAPSKGALNKRKEEFRDNRKLILFLSNEHMKEMLIKQYEKMDPSNLLFDLIDEFMLKY